MVTSSNGLVVGTEGMDAERATTTYWAWVDGYISEEQTWLGADTFYMLGTVFEMLLNYLSLSTVVVVSIPW